MLSTRQKYVKQYNSFWQYKYGQSNFQNKETNFAPVYLLAFFHLFTLTRPPKTYNPVPQRTLSDGDVKLTHF